MAVCKFYQQGNCRYGNSCKFEHPRQDNNRGGWQQSNNRFGALAGGQSNSGNKSGRQADTTKYPGLTEDGIRADLTTELPQWILSCYSPTKNSPVNLFGNYPREQSPEEIRMYYMMGAMSGNPDGALADIQKLHQVAQDQIQNTLSNIPAAIDHILRSENEHPNRHDIIKGNTNAASGGVFGAPAQGPFSTPAAAPSNPFGAPPAASSTSSPFGQPSALGQKPNPFGQPSQPTPSAFGQPVNAFGQPAQPATNSPFGQPAQQSGFGQTSALGANANVFGKPAAFGQPAALGGNKVFGQPAAPAFGQSAFGQPAQAPPSAFGQPAALGAKPNPFGQVANTIASTAAGSPFGGQPQQQPQQSNVFGQPPAPAAAPGPFGQPASAAAPSAFGQPAVQPAQNPFGQPPAQQAVAAAPGPFGQQQQQTAAQNRFGTQPAASNPFGQPPQPAAPGGFGGVAAQAAAAPAGAQGQGPYGPGAQRQHPPIESYSSTNPDGSLRMFKGKQVSYEIPKGGEKPVPVVRNFDGSFAKIWMPAGPPNYTTETEAEPEKYDDPAVQQQWMAFMQTGTFAGGIMPEVPPKREYCQWDF
ncbi:hypothetical protein QBC35DRAFT_229762 [Podospora australis]|uniref:C3H1-type domain-containing protein n=1 Tax=Podospora australis TaxID=1536484 RepID=A0AAN7AJ98_9PEZI|nr:hypothetical protein QBC35DRAFT_229762 [Podospora australis]